MIIRKITFTFHFRNNTEQIRTYKVEENDTEKLEYLHSLSSAIHKNMLADLGSVVKLDCEEGLCFIRLGDVTNLIIKGL